jgi:RNA polymerase sigma-70 factor, ECF subfamily
VFFVSLWFFLTQANQIPQIVSIIKTEGRADLVSHSEEKLIKRAQVGDADAFCQLTRSYERRIYSLALQYCRNPHDAEDLSQEVWLKAYRNLTAFRGDSSFYTWLRQIMINTFLNYKREKRIESLDSLENQESISIDKPSDMEGDIYKKILIGKVLRGLGELTPQQRLIFLLKHREGMTYEEISKAIGCSVGTIKKSLFRTLLKLREQLNLNLESECYKG